MKQIFKKVLWSCALFIPQVPLYGMVSYAVLKAPSGQFVEIIGDHHGLPEEQARADMKNFIAVVKHKKLSKPLAIAIELHEYYLKNAKKIGKALTVAPSISELLRGADEQACELVAAEERGLVSDQINGLFLLVDGPLEHYKDHDWSQELPALREEIARLSKIVQVSTQKGQVPGLSVAQSFDFYDKMFATLERFQKLYAENTKISSVIEHAIK